MIKNFIRWVLNRLPRRVIQRVAHLAAPVLALAWAGRRVECPVCGGGFRKFLPYGYAAPRENALCPACLSLERHRLLWLWLREQHGFWNSKPKMLHIAPERCFMRRFERHLGENYITADLESPLAKVKMDIQNMPFGEGEFDVIFCNHILEHVPDDALALREMRRVLKSGGWGVAMAPVDLSLGKSYSDPLATTPAARTEAHGQHDHLRIYGADYPQILASAGFEVREVDYAAGMTPDQRRRRGLTSGEIIYVIKKA